MHSDFYVYQWIREDGTPYYIGKGKGKRAWKRGKNHIPPDDRTNIVILAKGLPEHEAYLLEIYLISMYGRRDLGTGTLKNLTPGGGGQYRKSTTSEETREKMRRARLGKPLSKESLAKRTATNLGKKKKPHSEEAKAKMRLAKLGKVNVGRLGTKHSEKSRAKMSESAKNRKPRNVDAT